jgi:lia operon protein LiaF
MNGNVFHRLFWGLIIIVLGIGFLLRQTGLLDFDIGELFARFWPVFPILVGIQGLMAARTSGNQSGWWSGGIPLAIGIIFLGRNLGVFTWSFGEIIQVAWPVILIVVGMNMILRPRGSRRRRGSSDEWREYPSPPPMPPDGRSVPPMAAPIPPAPPLHPDPFKPGNETPPAAPDYEMSQEEARHARRNERQEYRDTRREMRHQGKHHRERVEWWNSDPGVQTRSGFIGDIHLGHDYWELKPMNISHFIGDTVLDLTKAQIPAGETKITISSFIGDVKVFIPNDFEVGIHVVSSAFLGDASVLEQREGGLFKNMNVETPYYHETDKKIRLIVSTFIGDVRVTKVG